MSTVRVAAMQATYELMDRDATIGFHLYAQGVDLWLAPTLAVGDAWVASISTWLARTGCSSSA